MLLTSACSTPTRNSDPISQEKRSSRLESSVDITYILGRDHHRLLAESKEDKITAQAFRDRKILIENIVSPILYSDFLRKASDFIDQPRRSPAEIDRSCRTPFKITVKIGNETRALNGCRSAEGPSERIGISHLVRDGESLLYSKK